MPGPGSGTRVANGLPGGHGREQVALERLDRTAAALEAAGPGGVERVRAGQEAWWQTMFEFVLEGLDDQEQQRAADELRDVLADLAGGRAAAVGPGAVAVAGDVGIQPRRAARRPGRWATSRPAIRLPGRVVRRRGLSSRAGPAADRPRHR